MRPQQSFHGFYGQRPIVASLQKHCDGAKLRNTSVPHIRFDGASGIGKTELAKALASEIGSRLHSFFCSAGTKVWQIAKHFANIQKSDVVFLDEVHALSDSAQEILYPALDRNQVPRVDPEKNRIVDHEWIEVPSFTMVVATDQPGSLKNALRQRLPLHYAMAPYNLMELREIVRNCAAHKGLLLSDQAVTRIAEAARGLPRGVRHLLESVSLCVPDVSQEISKTVVADILITLGVDSDNLNNMDRRYLELLPKSGNPVSLETLVLRLGSDAITVRREVETYLAERGLIAIGSRGRSLTAEGQKYIQERITI